MKISPKVLYDRIGARYRGRPVSPSEKLWQLRRAARIASHNPSVETILEKSVAMLAKNRHMPGYFNRCPVAAGIFGVHALKNSAVALVHWSASDRRARLMELKWRSDEPSTALQQILRYGMFYLFCRVHRNELPVRTRQLVDARHVALEVVAPRSYYRGFDGRRFVAETSKELDRFAKSKIGEALSMSLLVLAFPRTFDRVPFRNERLPEMLAGRVDE